MPKISVFMPSYNKRGFGVEAAKSVLCQSFADWEFWILENSTDGKTRNILHKNLPLDDPRIIYKEIDLPEEVRSQHYPTAYLLNRYYPEANGDIILYVSDDDLFVPGIFREVVSYFDDNPDHDALYFHLARTMANRPGEGTAWYERWAGITADATRGIGKVDCFIDGGQIAYRKKVLDVIEQPYFQEEISDSTDHADGLHLEKVVQAGFKFYPLKVKGVIHRHTPVSTWTKIPSM